MRCGSASMQYIDSRTWYMLCKGDHCSPIFWKSKQLSQILILGWYIFVVKRTSGGSKGYCVGMLMVILKRPPSYGESGGPSIQAFHSNKSYSTGSALHLGGGLFAKTSYSFFQSSKSAVSSFQHDLFLRSDSSVPSVRARLACCRLLVFFFRSNTVHLIQLSKSENTYAVCRSVQTQCISS